MRGGLSLPMYSITMRMTGLPFCSITALAAARDCNDPKGKSAGPGRNSVACNLPWNRPESPLFRIFLLSLTVCPCSAYGLREPVRELAVSRVGFQLFASHALEQLV